MLMLRLRGWLAPRAPVGAAGRKQWYPRASQPRLKQRKTPFWLRRCISQSSAGVFLGHATREAHARGWSWGGSVSCRRTGSSVSSSSSKCQTSFPDKSALTADVSGAVWIFKSKVIFGALNSIKKRRLSRWRRCNRRES